ncbi:arginine deiminase-related protein [Endozoicomonas lisbonensis]|uniref:arginine deiminase-related protein n=1 Tax=Endozoicomonas lisbonensis TaxID=3120522 RepID=UPI003397006A
MPKKTLQEYTAVKQQLHNHHIHVIELPAYHAPDTPDSVFPNNWFISFPAPCPENVQCGSAGNTLITLFPMLANQRKKKSRITALQKALNQQAISSQYNDEVLKNMTASQSLDGASSMVLDRDKKIIFAALSPRTNQTLLQEFADRQGYKLLAFRTVFYDQPVYHTSMMLSIGADFAVLCSECISEKEHRQQVWQALSDKTVIDITPDQTRKFAGNLLQLENDRGKAITVLSRTAFQSLNDEQLRVLNSFSDQLLVFDIPTIETYGGGSAGCMLAEIFLQPTLIPNPPSKHELRSHFESLDLRWNSSQ